MDLPSSIVCVVRYCLDFGVLAYARKFRKFTDHCHRFICIFGYMVVVKRSAFGGLCELCELS